MSVCCYLMCRDPCAEFATLLHAQLCIELWHSIDCNMAVYFLAIAPMVQCAKGLAQNPRDPSAVTQWRGANHQVLCQLVYCTVSDWWVCISVSELIQTYALWARKNVLTTTPAFMSDFCANGNLNEYATVHLHLTGLHLHFIFV